MDDQTLTELRDKLVSCGLTSRQAECYIYLHQCLHLPENARAQLPSDEQLRTLEEALRIRAAKDPAKFSCDEIHRCLQVPCTAWMDAKAAIADSFGISAAEVDALYSTGHKWLFVSPTDVAALRVYLQRLFADPGEALPVFRRAALLGADASISRIEAVLRMMGRDMGRKLILADIRQTGLLFERSGSDPVGCIARLLHRGLTPVQVLEAIEKDSFVLYRYRDGRDDVLLETFIRSHRS